MNPSSGATTTGRRRAAQAADRAEHMTERNRPRTGFKRTIVGTIKQFPNYLRLLGGLMVLSGMVVMAWNTWMTVANGRSVTVAVPVPQAA